MSDLQRIIFIDIDGPVINTPCYWVDSMASIHRAVLNTQAIGILNRLCKLGSALIVTNSTHNHVTIRETGRTLKTDLIKWGLRPEHIHEDWRTDFPWPDWGDGQNIHRRLKGIMGWQEKNGKADWICFDDEPFVTDDRLFVIDFDYGIDYHMYLSVCEHWKLDPKGFII
jgi:hypothetical protein